MKRFFDAYGRFVGRRPWAAIAFVIAGTAIAMYGFSITPDQADQNDSFLPESSELIAASADLAESFPSSSSLESVQVILRGNVLSPAGAADAVAATAAVARHPDLDPYLVAGQPPTSPGHLLTAMLAGGGSAADVDLGSTSQTDIDAAIADPENGVLADALESLVARDAAGQVVGGLGVVTVNAIDSGLVDAQLVVDQAVKDVSLTGLESARTFSNGKLADDSDATGALGALMGIALIVIAVLLVAFYRSGSDVALGILGLILTIVWALGFQGVLGPDGLSVVGAPSVMAQMVPIMMIGLCVDYSIQFTSRYREAIAEGASPEDGITESVSAVWLPLGLAGGTTIISFLTNLFGDIPGIADFGVIAGVGVASGLFIFLTGIPAARLLLDRRSVARGKTPNARPMRDAIPGAGALVQKISSAAVNRPGAILAATGLVTVILGGLISQLGTEFNTEDFLLDGSETKADFAFLTENLGGNTEPVTLLVEADLTSDRTVRNLLDLSDGLADPALRPEAVASEVTQSLGVVANNIPVAAAVELNAIDFTRDGPLFIAPETVQQALDVIEGGDPEGFDSVVAYGLGDGPDRTLLQFSAFTGDTERSEALVSDVESLWYGDDAEITTISNEIIALEVTNSLTSSQATSIALTLLAALVVLMFFFWATEFRPMLAVISVLPIVLVLIWVLGTMVILGYSYNVITALITALSIGIGVDYTIHVTHRFLEEREHGSHTLEAALQKTMSTTGGALIGSALTTALGFMVLIFSPITPMGQFGLLTAITVLYSLIAAIVVLPPLLVIWAAYHDWRNTHLTALERTQLEEAAGSHDATG